MTNPFTFFLRQWNRNPDLDEFVAYWDGLEQVMVGVYRKKMTLAEAEPEFRRVWPWLRREYDAWREVLRPFWQQTKAAGIATQTDPFQLLLAIQTPQEISSDWRAMQHLPAAREALNQYILSQVEA
ncbi:MAG: hypothetical protein KBE23_00290 [Chloroflexi bacterium]|nr:hypothetical protein [Chloroflexota bacterium]MBP7041151.1 hypothetical protein [Chloroflexota bacterium]